MNTKLTSAFINSCHHVVSEIPQLLPFSTDRNMVASSDLFYDGFIASILARLARDGMTDKGLFCIPAQALLMPKTGQPLRYCTKHCGHCTKPVPHRLSLELGDQTSVQDHLRLPTAVHEKNCILKWLMSRTHLPDIDLPQGSVLSPHVMGSCLFCHRVREQTWSCWALFLLPASWTSACLLPGITAWCGKKTPETLHYPKGRWSVNCHPRWLESWS